MEHTMPLGKVILWWLFVLLGAPVLVLGTALGICALAILIDKVLERWYG